ncbi:hypothetical protein DENSPDRAFT_903176 [Dentipellis sp. KUC8613]|nr:hypothetical protein DENSPDRAFT_903176 [Dentipellis sp. KUC8613]
MKFASVVFGLGLFTATALAHPLHVINRRASADGPTDVDILNFALTLEHLESTFYAQGLARFSARDFESAGLPAWAYGRVKQIAAHEATHVSALAGALGKAAVQPCTYKFPYTDPKSFMKVSQALESVGTSAYTGAARFIQNKDYLLVAAEILSVEARHSSWVGSSIEKEAGWSGAFETPLDLNQVYSLAAGFITACPNTNAPLPVHAFAPLTLSSPTAGAAPTAGSVIALQFGSHNGTALYAAFLNGQSEQVVPLDAQGHATVPQGLKGTTYVLVVNDSGTVQDGTTVAGPAILDLAFGSDE